MTPEIIGDCTLHCGDALGVLKTMPSEPVQTCITSPPYWGLRDYGHEGQMGLENSPEEYVGKLVEVFREVRRVLRNDGTLWLNLGDTYAGRGNGGGNGWGFIGENKGRDTYKTKRDTPPGLKPKDLVGIPWRVALALQSDGWYLRSDIIWHKPNGMPESVTDRPTKAHEYIFLLSKNERYYYDANAIKEPAISTSLRKFTDNGVDKQRGHGRKHSGFNGRYAENLARRGVPTHRNARSVWTVATRPFPDAHFATFPIDLIKPCILAGAPAGGVVLDPFSGAGTAGMAALAHGRSYIGIELSPEYHRMAQRRITKFSLQGQLFASSGAKT